MRSHEVRRFCRHLLGLNCILLRLHPTRRDCCVDQFNLRGNPASLLDDFRSPYVVNHTFLYLYPRDKCAQCVGYKLDLI